MTEREIAEVLQAIVDDATYADNYRVKCGGRLAHAVVEQVVGPLKDQVWQLEDVLADVANRYVPVDQTIDVPAVLNRAVLASADRDARLALLGKTVDDRAKYFRAKQAAYPSEEVWWRARAIEAEEIAVVLRADAGAGKERGDG